MLPNYPIKIAGFRTGFVGLNCVCLNFISISVLGLLLPFPKAIALTDTPDTVLSSHPASLKSSSSIQLAQVLGCPRAEVIEAFETASFYVYICQGQGGAVFYRGLSKSDGSQINVMDVQSGDDGTYYATNGDITYAINPNELRVMQNGQVILSEPVLR